MSKKSKGPGRPELPDSERRKMRATSVSDEEYDQMLEARDLDSPGKSFSSWAREVLLAKARRILRRK